MLVDALPWCVYRKEMSRNNLADCAGSNKVPGATAAHDQSHPAKNYLMSGGYRAAAKDRDDQLLQLNRAAIKACTCHVHTWHSVGLCFALPIQEGASAGPAKCKLSAGK